MGFSADEDDKPFDDDELLHSPELLSALKVTKSSVVKSKLKK
jgi:hypothetical protein